MLNFLEGDLISPSVFLGWTKIFWVGDFLKKIICFLTMLIFVCTGVFASFSVSAVDTTLQDGYYNKLNDEFVEVMNDRFPGWNGSDKHYIVAGHFNTNAENWYSITYYLFTNNVTRLDFTDNALIFKSDGLSNLFFITNYTYTISNDSAMINGGSGYYDTGISKINYGFYLYDGVNNTSLSNLVIYQTGNIDIYNNGTLIDSGESSISKYNASVTADGSLIKYNVEFLQEGSYEVELMACAGENGDNPIDYPALKKEHRTYYYDGESEDVGGGDNDDLGIAGGDAIDSIIAGMNGETVSTKSVYYELDLQDFYDKVQDKENFKKAEMIYYTIKVKDVNSDKVDYFSCSLEPNTLADTIKDKDSGLFSTRKDYISFPTIFDYIKDEFPDIADYVNFDMFRNMDFVEVGGLDAVLDVLKNVWIVIKTIFLFLVGNLLDVFIWFWAVLKFIFFGILGMFEWLGACLWVIIQNIGVALYNLVVDIRRLLSWLFVPGSSFFNTYLSDFKKSLYNKFGVVGEIKLFFETLIDNLSGNAEAPVWEFTLFGKKCNFIDFSAFDNYRDIVHSVILAIAWVKFAKKIIVSIPSIIGGSNIEVSENSTSLALSESREIRPL